jgi:hypothetical protein
VVIGIVILIAVIAWAVGRGSSTTTTSGAAPPPPPSPPIDESDAYEDPSSGESGA